MHALSVGIAFSRQNPPPKMEIPLSRGEGTGGHNGYEKVFSTGCQKVLEDRAGPSEKWLRRSQVSY